MKSRRTWVVLPLVLLSATASGPVSADDGWILEERQSAIRTLLGLKLDTAYKRSVHLPSGLPDRLVRAYASVAGDVTLQQVGLESGSFQMLDIHSLELSASSTPHVGKGPRHLLLLLQDLRRPLKAGDSFDLTLFYEHAEPHTLTVRVQPWPEVLAAMNTPMSVGQPAPQPIQHRKSLLPLPEASVACV
jgi:periplasmic copper chaperone A